MSEPKGFDVASRMNRLEAEVERLREAVGALNRALEMASHHCPIYEEESDTCKICVLIQSSSLLLMPKAQAALEWEK